MPKQLMPKIFCFFSFVQKARGENMNIAIYRGLVPCTRIACYAIIVTTRGRSIIYIVKLFFTVIVRNHEVVKDTT